MSSREPDSFPADLEAWPVVRFYNVGASERLTSSEVEAFSLEAHDKVRELTAQVEDLKLEASTARRERDVALAAQKSAEDELKRAFARREVPTSALSPFGMHFALRARRTSYGRRTATRRLDRDTASCLRQILRTDARPDRGSCTESR